MKLLVLTKKFPYPLRDGESQAIHGLTKSLSELGAEVCLLAMNTSKHYFALRERPAETNGRPAELDHYREIRTVDICTDLSARKAFGALLRWESYHLSRFDSPAYRESLTAWLREEHFDVVQLETLYLAPYVDAIRANAPQALVSMRAHNVEYEIWQRYCDNVRSPLRRGYMRLLTHQLREYELDRLNGYDLTLPITARDEAHFRSVGLAGESMVLPIGLDTAQAIPDYDTYRRPPSLAFIGSLDWMPNLEGLEWFLDRVWPTVRAAYPDLTFHVAGRNMPAYLLRMQRPGVVVHGEVPDSNAYLNNHSISIVPLLSGSGMRAKILQSMALGRTVVTTSVGLEGIEAQDGQDVLVADPPAAFARVLIDCLADARSLERIGRNAQRTFEQHYDRLRITERLLDRYHRMLAGRPTVLRGR